MSENTDQIKKNNRGEKFNLTVEIPSGYHGQVKTIVDKGLYKDTSEFFEEAIKEFVIKLAHYCETYGLKAKSRRILTSISISSEYKAIIESFSGSEGIFTGRADLARQAVREKLERESATYAEKGLLPSNKSSFTKSNTKILSPEQFKFLLGKSYNELPVNEDQIIFIPPDSKERILIPQIRKRMDGTKELYLKQVIIKNQV